MAKKNLRKVFALLLSISMTLGLIAVPAFAEDNGEAESVSPATEETTQEKTPEPADPTANPVEDPEGTPEPEPEPAKPVYVSATGNNETGDGSQGKPYATLTKAVEEAEDGSTIYVLTDLLLTDTETARITDKHVTITSADPENPVTLTRGEGITAADNFQSWHNGAMIEVTTSDTASGASDNASSVTLTNIVLTDKGKHDGTYFAQTNNTINGEKPENGNLAFVQDAIVTAHGLSERKVNIVLGEGAVLQDFGGMSAVYATGNAQITMQSGSIIEDTIVTDRTRSDVIKNCPPEEVGPAGAIWLQGSSFVMEDGSKIRNMVGRAVYADSGTVTINGTISDISGDADMWQGKGGVAVHVRNNADVTFGSTALFDNTNVSAKIDSAVYVNQGSFEMVDGAKICNLAGTAVQGYGSTTQPEGSINITIDGEICGIINGGNAINLNESGGLYCKIGPNADIHHNTVWAATLYAQGPGVKIDLYGTIRDNISTQYSAGIWLANNFNGAKLTMYDDAKITGNISVGEGAAVIVSEGTFTMNGGSIFGNYALTDPLAGGVSVRRNGTFIMNDGAITGNMTTGNGGGIRYNDDSRDNECVILNGGTISGNIANADAVLNEETGKYTFSGGVSNDISVAASKFSHVNRYIAISNDMTIGNKNIYVEKYGLTLTNPGDGVKFGNASPDGIDAVTTAAEGKGWSSNALASLWALSDEPITVLEISKPVGATTSPIYAGVVAVSESGEPVEGASVNFYPVVEQNGKLTIQFPSTTNGSVVALVQPTEDYGSMTASAPDALVGKQNADTTYQIPYSFKYTISENLKNRLAAENLEGISIQIQLDPALFVDTSKITFTSNVFVAGKATCENGLLTIPCTLQTNLSGVTNWDTTVAFSATLQGVDFTEGKTLAASGGFYAKIGANQILVPSNPVVTLLKTKATITATAGANGTITPSSAEVDYGGNATFTITADNGYHVSDVKVDGVSVGAVSTYTFSNVIADHIIAATFAQNSSGGGGGGGTDIPDPETPLGPLPELNKDDHFAYIVGREDGKAHPMDNITRAEVATIFYRLLTDETREAYWGTVSTYSDVEQDAWYMHAVATLTNAGVLNGRGDGKFAPEAPITRAEFAAVAARFFGGEYEGPDLFTDIENSWAREYINRAAELGIIKGLPDGTFNPGRSITRAEAIAMINRTLERHPHADYLLEEMTTFSDNMDTNAWYYADIQEATNSHDYKLTNEKDEQGNRYEEWTDLRSTPDWSMLEQQWEKEYQEK